MNNKQLTKHEQEVDDMIYKDLVQRLAEQKAYSMMHKDFIQQRCSCGGQIIYDRRIDLAFCTKCSRNYDGQADPERLGWPWQRPVSAVSVRS